MVYVHERSGKTFGIGMARLSLLSGKGTIKTELQPSSCELLQDVHVRMSTCTCALHHQMSIMSNSFTH